MRLNRVLDLPAVTFISIGFMIGGGVFIFTGIVLDIVGRALPLAYGLAMIPVFISMLPLAMLGAAIPSVGASYVYPSRMVSPGLAFLGVWIYALASFFGQIPLYALGCARYAATLKPDLPQTTFALGLVTLFFVINILGLQLAARVQALLVVLLLCALAYYSVVGVPAIDWSRLDRGSPVGAPGLLLGTALLTFTYFGANGIIELGGEIIAPDRVIPRAFLIAFPVVAVIYISVATTTVGVADLGSLEAAEEPLVYVIGRTAGRWGQLFFMLFGALLALATTLNALFIVGTKALLMIVEDRIFPSWLGSIHPRFGTPWLLLLIAWGLSVLGIIAGQELQTLASYAALGGLIIFLPLQIAALRFPSLYPELYHSSRFRMRRGWLWLAAGVGILMVIFFGAVILVDLKSPAKIGCFVMFILSGVVYYRARKRFLRRRGVELEELIRGRGGWGS